LLSVPVVGRIYGRCRPGEPRWPIEVLNDGAATDIIIYRVGAAPPRRVSLNPGGALTLQLVPGRYVSHEPADPSSHSAGATIKTTVPVAVDFEQGTEPHDFHVHVRFAVAAAVGDTTNCALISTSMTAATYYSGGQPPS
jgi:hypothetical protein